MLKIIPKRFKWQWSILFLLFTVIISLPLALYRDAFSSDFWLRFLALGAVVSFVCCIGGFFGARLYFWVSSGITLAGYLYMFYIFATMGETGWDDLIGLLSFIFIFFIAIIAGILTQLIVFIVKKVKKRKNKTISE